MRLDLRETVDGVVLKVRVSAGSRDSSIRGLHEGALKVAVRQVAEKGKANKAVIALLGKHLGIAASQIEVVSGHTQSNKQILVRGLDRSELADKLS